MPTHLMGEEVDGIQLTEENRQSSWEYYTPGIELLYKICRESFTSKGKRAVVAGVWAETNPCIRYAIFVEPGFLTPIDDE